MLTNNQVTAISLGRVAVQSNPDPLDLIERDLIAASVTGRRGSLRGRKVQIQVSRAVEL